MLLEDKIEQLVFDENFHLISRYDAMVKKLETEGKFSTRNMITIKIIFYLLSLEFDFPYLNWQLYKRLMHLLHQTEMNVYITTQVTPPATVSSIVATPSTVDVGDVLVGEFSISSFDLAVSNVNTPIVVQPGLYCTASVNEEDEFVSPLLLIPYNGTLTVPTIYIKYTPLADETVNRNLTLTSDETSETVALTGTAYDPFVLSDPAGTDWGNITVGQYTGTTILAITGATHLPVNVAASSSDFLISSDGFTFGPGITITPVNNIIDVNIFVKGYASELGAALGTVTFSNTELTYTITLEFTGV